MCTRQPSPEVCPEVKSAATWAEFDYQPDGVSFFRPVEYVPEAAEPIHVHPPWFGPPPGALPGLLADRAVLVRNERK